MSCDITASVPSTLGEDKRNGRANYVKLKREEGCALEETAEPVVVPARIRRM
jgi:hypothetical protein